MEKSLSVLILDDIEYDVTRMVAELERRGFSVSWQRVASVEAFRGALDAQSWDVVIADYEESDGRAIDALKLVKTKELDVPFIIVSGTAREAAVAEMFEFGAHDYVMKDSLLRLGWAVERELRHVQIRREHLQRRRGAQQNDDQLRTLFDSSPDAIFVESLQGQVLHVNRAACRLHGMNREELIGTNVLELVPEGQRATVRRDFAKLVDGTLDHAEGCSLTKDGRSIPVELRVSRISYDDRPALLLHVRDIAERKHAEQQLMFTNFSVDRCQTAVFWITSDTGFFYVNDAACQQLGYSRQELLKLRVADVDADHTPAQLQNVFQAIKEQEILHIQSHCRRKDGSVFPVEITANFMVYDGREYVFAFCQDISQRARDEKALQDNEEQYRGVFEASSDGIAITKPDGTLVQVNQAWCTMHGVTRDEALKLKPEQFIHPDSVHLFEGFLHALDSDQSFHCEAKDIRKDGTCFDIEVHGVAFQYGGSPHVLGIIRDITERKRAEESLRIRDRAMSSTSNGIIITDAKLPDNPIVYCNSAFQEMTGYSEREILGRNCRFLQNDDRDQPGLKAIRVAITDERECRVVLRNYRKSGELFWNELTLSPVFDDQERLTHFVGIQNDITARKQFEAGRESQLRHLQVMDQVNAVVTGTDDVEQLLDNVLNVLLDAIGCDRVWLAHPCDPETPTVRIPFEATTPDYPGVIALQLGDEFPVDDRTRAMISKSLANDGAVAFSPAETREGLGPQLCDQFGIRSLMVMAVHPRAGQPWTLGFHQCTHERIWTDEDRRLVQDIGRRLEDALTSVLIHRELRKSEQKFRTLADSSPAMVSIYRGNRRLYVNRAAEEFTGYSSKELLEMDNADIVHPDHREMARERNQRRQAGESVPSRHEIKILTKSGETRWIDLSVSMIDYESEPAVLGTSVDITQRKRAEELARKSESRLRLLLDCAALAASTLDVEELLDRLIKRIAEVISAATIGAVYLYDPECEELGFVRKLVFCCRCRSGHNLGLLILHFCHGGRSWFEIDLQMSNGILSKMFFRRLLPPGGHLLAGVMSWMAFYGS